MLKKALVVGLLGLGMSGVAMANGWQVKVGASSLAPSGDTRVNGVGVVKADQEYGFTPSVEYFFNDLVSAELLLATPFNHDVAIDGANSVRIKHLPPTVTVKYNFANSTRFTPYIGLGGTAFIAWDEDSRGPITGTKVKVKEAFGWAGQVGFNFQPADAKNWGVYADVRYADLSPEVDVKLNGARIANFDLDIDPFVYTIGYSYKF